MEYIDNDTCKFVDNFVSPDISCDGYVRVSTNLIVLIFPWHHFDRQQSGFTDVEVLKDAVKTCKSESLAGIRMLFECYRLP